MKIIGYDGTAGASRPTEVPGAQGDVKRGSGTQRGPTTGGDKVSLSDEARALSRLRTEVGDVSGVRAEKVEEVRGRIERGEFQIDLKAVARKFIESILLR